MRARGKKLIMSYTSNSVVARILQNLHMLIGKSVIYELITGKKIQNELLPWNKDAKSNLV